MGCLRKLQVAERWFVSGGRSPKLDDTVLILMVLHQLVRAELVVVVWSGMSKEWLRGFSRRLGCLNSFVAELWGLRDGLMVCKNMQLNAVNVQIDAMAVVQLLTRSTNNNLSVLPLIDDCKKLISQIPHVQIMHCYREANSCADSLASIGTVQERSFILYQDPPVDLLELLSSDRDGLYVNRTIFDSSFPA